MSDDADLGPAYRHRPSLSAAALVARCLCAGRYGASRTALFLGLTAAILVTGPHRASAPAVLALAALGLLQALRQIPLLTLRARVIEGDIVVTGCRWPGPDATWSCGLHEVSSFELETRDDEPGGARRRVALRTTDGRLFGLTEKLYPEGEKALRAAVERLNAWLAPLRSA